MSVALTPREAAFFVAGGTVPPDSLSYVERSADVELFDGLLAGEYCYVLNSRQMGKSSLAVRVMGRLSRAGARCAFVDLTKIGAAGVSEEQWYAGVLAEVARTLGLRRELAAHLREHASLSPNQRLIGFLQDVVANLGCPVVVLVDEVDAVRSLSFSADAFFAGIRQCWNARSTEAQLKSLTFCLLGAALPGDLIRDARTTPFNMGRRIELRDFTLEEARPFADALGDETLLARVLHWTGGHPFLTQALCRDLLERGGDLAPASVDLLVRERYLDQRARDTDTNLADVGNRLLGRGDPNVGDEQRQDTLASYARLLRSGIPDDESNPSCARIKMSGVTRLERGVLRPRNRIYRSVFGPEWIRENMPRQELRRQRRAFWKGVLRTAGISATVLGVIGYLALNNARLARIAEDRRERAEYDAYVASMQTMPLSEEEGNFDEINRKLETLKASPSRNWEWAYWNHVANGGATPIWAPDFVFGDSFSRDGRYLVGVSLASDRIEVVDMERRRIDRSFPIQVPAVGSGAQALFEDGDRRIVVGSADGWLTAWDANTGHELAQMQYPGLQLGTPAQVGPRQLFGLQSGSPVLINALTLEIAARPALPSLWRAAASAGQSGKLVSWVEVPAAGKDLFSGVVARAADGKEIDRMPLSLGVSVPALSPDDRYVAFGNSRGEITVRDIPAHRSHVYPILNTYPSSIRYSPDGRQMIVSGSDRRAKLFDMGTRKVIREFPNSYFAAFTPSGKSIYTVYGTVRVYDAKTQAASNEFTPPHAWSSTSLRHAGHLSYWGSCVGSILDLMQEGAIPRNFSLKGRVGSVIESETDAVRLANDSRQLEIMRLGSEHPDLRLPLPAPNTNLALAISPDGRWVAYQGAVYDRRDGQPEQKPVATIPEQSPGGACFSLDGKWLFMGDVSGLVTLWRVGEWQKPLWAYRDRTLGVLHDAKFSPDGRRIALALSIDDGVVVDAATGRPLVRLVGHSQTLNKLAWAPDGQRLATGSDDHTVRLWDANTGRQLCIVGRHDSAVSEVAFLPGGRTIASVGRTLKLWKSDDRR